MCVSIGLVLMSLVMFLKSTAVESQMFILSDFICMFHFSYESKIHVIIMHKSSILDRGLELRRGQRILVSHLY